MEALHAGEEDTILQVAQHAKEDNVGPEPLGPEGLNDNGRTPGLCDTPGLLIATDSDYKRAHLLIHQMKRLSSPNLIVTSHDATLYPSIKLPPLPAPEGQRPINRHVKFGRILDDVLCSGDGTAKKNIGVWKDWSPTSALGLHTTQVRILFRAL
jgi:multisite-specific tRNA:(cytosine-C5)-methyltransferase